MKDLTTYAESLAELEQAAAHAPSMKAAGEGSLVLLLTNSIVVDDPEISHWIAVREIAHELCASGANVRIIDVNHKTPCALINTDGSQTLVRYPRKEGDSASLTRQLCDAIAEDERFAHVECGARVLLGSDHDLLPEKEAILFAANELAEEAKNARCVFVTGGIFQPYKIEPFLSKLEVRLIYYAMNFRNDSRYRDIYSICLTASPRTTARFWEGPVVRRPTYVGGAMVSACGLSTESEHALAALVPLDAVCIACTRHLAGQLVPEYLGKLAAQMSQTPDLKFLAIGLSQTALNDRAEQALGREAFRRIEPRLLAIPYETNLTDLFERLAAYRACFMNPPSPGNGGSILFAAQSGLATLVIGANDAEYVCAGIEDADMLASPGGAFQVLDKCYESDAYRARVLAANASAVAEAKVYSGLLFGLAWQLS